MSPRPNPTRQCVIYTTGGTFKCAVANDAGWDIEYDTQVTIYEAVHNATVNNIGAITNNGYHYIDARKIVGWFMQDWPAPEPPSLQEQYMKAVMSYFKWFKKDTGKGF